MNIDVSEKNAKFTNLIKIKNVGVGGNEKILISGPCAVENYDTMLAIAKKLKDLGVHMLRGGVFKPRTSPYDFQGLGFQGLEIIKEVGRLVDMPVSTEIMDPRHVEKALDYIDALQIGSRNMYNYTLLSEVGKTNIPIILKRGMGATIKEWIFAAEYIAKQGNDKIIMCERGIRTFEDATRNTLDLNAVAYLKHNTSLPVIVDPSHGTGLRELVYPMSLASLASGADGLIIESHISPDKSISDARQTISMEELEKIVSKLNIFKSK